MIHKKLTLILVISIFLGIQPLYVQAMQPMPSDTSMNWLYGATFGVMAFAGAVYYRNLYNQAQNKIAQQEEIIITLRNNLESESADKNSLQDTNNELNRKLIYSIKHYEEIVKNQRSTIKNLQTK